MPRRKRTREERLERVLGDVRSHTEPTATLEIDSSQASQILELNQPEEIDAVCAEIEKNEKVTKVSIKQVSLSFRGVEQLVKDVLLPHPTMETLSLSVAETTMGPSQFKLMKFEGELQDIVDLHNETRDRDQAAFLSFSQALRSSPQKPTLPDDLLGEVRKSLTGPRKTLNT